MKSCDFKLILGGISDVTDDQGDALFEAGCDDGTIVSRDGAVFVRFARIRLLGADDQLSGG
jgi:hypothetical protein